MQQNLTKEAIRKIQQSWGAGILTIGKAWYEGGNYRHAAAAFLKIHYGYFADKKGNIKINVHHSSLPYSCTF